MPRKVVAMIRILSMILLSTVAGASPAWAENGTAGGDPTRPIQTTARIEVARLLAAEAAAEPVTVAHQTQPRRRNWVQRHPVWTAAMVGFGSGFLIGYLPGDDAVFDDYVAGFNGAVVGGIGAGAGASIVAILQAVRRPLNP
jgi:hypothetical protein